MLFQLHFYKHAYIGTSLLCLSLNITNSEALYAKGSFSLQRLLINYDFIFGTLEHQYKLTLSAKRLFLTQLSGTKTFNNCLADKKYLVGTAVTLNHFIFPEAGHST